MKPTENQKKFAAALGKVVVDLCDMKPGSAIKGLLDAALAYKKDDPPPPTPDAAAELLLRRSAAVAAAAVFQRHRDLSLEAGAVDVETAAGNLALEIPLPDLTARTFAAPEGWAAMDALATLFGRWLAACHIPEDRRPEMTRTFRDEMPLALRAEFLERSKEYDTLTDLLDKTTHVDAAAKRTEDWRCYRAKLVADVAKPLPNIDRDRIPEFSLAELHVPLRATWTEPHKEGEKKKRHILWLHEALNGWIDAADPRDMVRVITGGPGSGKSSACRMLAADLARRGRRVLLAPLGRLEYHQEAVGALKKWAGEPWNLGHDPLAAEALDGAEPTILILDGLDELVKTGKVGERVVEAFVTELHQHIASRNDGRARILLLLAGRPLAAESTKRLARKPEATLEVTSFKIFPDGIYNDKNLSCLDQRDAWWMTIGQSGLPEPLKNKGPRLDDITAQPLLNWLLAQLILSKEQNNIDFSGSVYEIYQELLKYVLNKTHRPSTSEATDSLSAEQLERALEEIAIAAWHDGDRTVSLSTIKSRIESNQVETLNILCRQDHELAINALIDSFFIKPQNNGDEYRVFEFTHKSFREFLTVRRILREIHKIKLYIDSGAPYGFEMPLQDWFQFCGHTPMTIDLLTTLRDAIDDQTTDTLKSLGNALRILLNHTIQFGIPLPQTGGWTTKSVEAYTRNAEETLLALHSSQAASLAKRKTSSPLAFDGNIDALTKSYWLHRMIGQQHSGWIAPLCLNNCNLSYIVCNHINLEKSNLKYSNLTGASMIRANLKRANISHAILHLSILDHANLDSAKIRKSNLNEARLKLSNLFNADLSKSQLHNADLERANLFGSNLSFSDLSHSNFERATIIGSNFDNANLKHANFFSSNLEGTTFNNADLTHTKMDRANLTNANLSDTIITNTNFFKAKLNHVNIENSIISGANFTDTDLENSVIINISVEKSCFSGALFKGSRIENADLSNVNLDHANFDRATINSVNFTLAQIRGGSFLSATIKYAVFDGAILERAKFIDAKVDNSTIKSSILDKSSLERAEILNTDMENSRFQNAKMEHINLVRINLLRADLRDAKLINAKLINVNLDKSDLSNANLENARLKNLQLNSTFLKSTNLFGTDLTGASIKHSNLSRACLEKSNLTNSILEGAVLSAANLSGADLDNANLKGANLKGIKLEGAKLKGANLEGVQGLNDEELADLKRRAKVSDNDT